MTKKNPNPEATLETLAATAPTAVEQIEFAGLDGMSICSIMHSRRQHCGLENYKEQGMNLLIGLNRSSTGWGASLLDTDRFVPAEHAAQFNFVLIGRSWTVPCRIHSRNEAGENTVTETDITLTYSDHNPSVFKTQKHFVPTAARFQNFKRVKQYGWFVGRLGTERFLISAKTWNQVFLGEEVSWCGMNADGHFDICFRKTSEGASPELPI